MSTFEMQQNNQREQGTEQLTKEEKVKNLTKPLMETVTIEEYITALSNGSEAWKTETGREKKESAFGKELAEFKENGFTFSTLNNLRGSTLDRLIRARLDEGQYTEFMEKFNNIEENKD